MEGLGEVVTRDSSAGYYVRISVSCQPIDTGPASVTFNPSIPDCGPHTREWMDAVSRGAAFALKLADTLAHCTIKQIEGGSFKPNPILVMIAAMRAVWSAIGFKPHPDVAKALDSSIVASLQGTRNRTT
jgi:hypothetical protein